MAQVSQVAVISPAGRVVGLVHFHSGISAEVQVIAIVLLLGDVVLGPHEHVEGRVGLGLAVLDTGLLLIAGLTELELDAVLMALFEE